MIVSMMREFRTFVLRGNVVDLAVGVIIGAAFGAVINSLVTDILMPPIGFLLGGVDFSNLFLPLNGQTYATLAEAQAAGAPTVNVGVFLNTVINFLVVALAMFVVIKQVNFVLRKKPAPVEAPPPTKDCPFCKSAIKLHATRCPHCTSQLEGAPR